MAIGFYFALINRFDQESHEIPRHADNSFGADDPKCEYSRMKLLDKNAAITGETFTVPAYSGLVEKGVHKNGRSGPHVFDFFYEPLKFVFYKVSPMNIVAFSTGKGPARQFIRQLKKDSTSTLKLSEIDIDLSKAAATITNISGAWINGLRLSNPYLSSMGVFGTKVTNSDEYQKAIIQGQVSAIIFSHSFNGISRTSGISKQGSVFIFERMNSAAGRPNAAAELSFMLDIYKQYLFPLAVARR
jgi:hypothetical protein